MAAGSCNTSVNSRLPFSHHTVMIDSKQHSRDLKAAFRLSMNGVASQFMRQHGLNYRVNFGVELPRIETIVAERLALLEAEKATPCERRALAQSLWNEDVRESKIVALMLMPEGEFTADFAELWADSIPNVEIARLFVSHLLLRLPYAVDLAFRWIASEHDLRQVCGLLLAARLSDKGVVFEQRSMNELKDQSSASLSSKNVFISQAARALSQRICP